MSRQYPMWFKVTNCNYKQDKSYGGRNDLQTTLFVGSSSTNSEEFLRFRTTRAKGYWKNKPVMVFRHSVDNVVLKIAIFERFENKCGKLLKVITKLKSIKSLTLE